MARRNSKANYQALVNDPAFKEVLEWLTTRFEQPHLEAKPPSEILPNYGEVYAATAAQYRVVKDLKQMLDKRST